MVKEFVLKFVRFVFSVLALASLAACGTTYQMPKVDAAITSRADTMFVEAQAEPERRLASERTGIARFNRVARRVEPVAKKFCENELANKPDIDCNVGLELDRKMDERNAYFTYAKPGNKAPVIRFSLPILQDVKSDDEVAFILGHEYGHLIGQHIQKKQTQQLVGALIMGTLTAAANANNPYADPNAVSQNMELGAAVGGFAFSKTYELESDMLGTRIAHAAGYDPVKGAKFFARDEEVKSENGQLSFWGTHPADAERIAVVIATTEQIKARQALIRKQNSSP